MDEGIFKSDRVSLPKPRSDKLRDLFERALQLPPAERSAFLWAACPGDEGLRAEAAALLGHHDEAEPGFLRPRTNDQSGGDWTASRSGESELGASAASDPRIGSHVDGFKVVRIIGRGGMGTVYEAEQSHPRRNVALKVMNHRVLTPALRRRFLYEVETLGRLEHPNIARIYSAGVDGDPACAAPYFAMELVRDSRPITEYADAVGLDARARVALFIKVCDAVHHGHQKGVIHRDLKPGNILVGADAVPKVIDFGVARATDADIATTTMETAAGTIIGTVQYMSPEQCDADPRGIDTRSDVYSLGVILYELLTGRPPYDLSGKTITAALRTIQDAVPAPLAAENRRLRGDIETVVQKALQKSRETRYASAADLAQDLQRFLNREPIEARKPSRWQRVVGWVGRRPWTVGVVGTIAAAAISGVSVYGTIEWMRSHVVAVRSAKNGEEVEFVNDSGGVVRTVYGRQARAIPFCTFISNPNWSRRKLAIIGISHPGDRSGRLGGGLFVFDVWRDLNNPCWQGVVADGEPPPWDKGEIAPGGDFGFVRGFMFDVFPDSANRPEIVALFQHGSRTQSALRIYDLDGALRYEIWLMGQIDDLVWLPKSRRLVAAALNGHARWERRGVQDATSIAHAGVIFAIEPRDGFRSKEYLPQEREDRDAAPSELRPLWYLVPNWRVTAHYRTHIAFHSPTDFPVESVEPVYVHLSINDTTPLGAAVSFAFDADGKPLAPPRRSETYIRNHEQFAEGDPRRLPPVDVWTWEDDLPRIVVPP